MDIGIIVEIRILKVYLSNCEREQILLVEVARSGIKNKREDALKELIKTCLKAPAKDLLNLERNLLPPILCPAILPTVF